MTRIGIIGCGGMGKMHGQACLASPTAELICAADELRDKATEYAKQMNCALVDSPEELLKRDDIDAVMICTPTPSHHPLSLAALRAGKHVFVEKPLARTLALAEELVAEAERTGLFNQVGQVLRFWPEYTFLKKACDDNRWGKLNQIDLWRACAQPGWSENNWYLNPEISGGAALDLHLHDTDAVHYLFGAPKAVFSRGVKDETGWRHLSTQYILDSGPVVQAEGTWHNAEKYAFRMGYLAAFEQGVLDFDSSRESPFLFYPNQGEPIVPELPKPEETKPVEGINITDLGGYLLQDRYFFDSIAAGAQPTQSAFADGRDSLRTVEAEIRSAETGELVSL